GNRQRRHQGLAIPADRQRAPAPRSRVSPDRAAAVAAGMENVWGDYKPLPSPWRQAVIFDRTAYGRALIDEPHRSHASRYAVLIEDVRNDVTRFEPFFASAVRVVELDRKRNASLKLVSELSPREHADAVARMEEHSLI